MKFLLKLIECYKNQKQTVLAVLAIWVIAVILYLVFLLVFPNEGLRQNIIAEAIWSSLTLIFIDWIIETNNENKRLPAKLLSYKIVQGFFCKFSQEHPQKKSIRTFKTQIRSSGQPLLTDLVQDS